MKKSLFLLIALLIFNLVNAQKDTLDLSAEIEQLRKTNGTVLVKTLDESKIYAVYKNGKVSEIHRIDLAGKKTKFIAAPKDPYFDPCFICDWSRCFRICHKPVIH